MNQQRNPINPDVEWVVCRACQTPHSEPGIRASLERRTALCEGCERVLLKGTYEIV